MFRRIIEHLFKRVWNLTILPFQLPLDEYGSEPVLNECNSMLERLDTFYGTYEQLLICWILISNHLKNIFNQ